MLPRKMQKGSFDKYFKMLKFCFYFYYYATNAEIIWKRLNEHFYSHTLAISLASDAKFMCNINYCFYSFQSKKVLTSVIRIDFTGATSFKTWNLLRVIKIL